MKEYLPVLAMFLTLAIPMLIGLAIGYQYGKMVEQAKQANQ